MALVTDGIGKYLSGSIEGLVFVKGKDFSYMRGTPRVRKAGEWTEKQREARKGFQSVINFANAHKTNVIVPIWNKAAKDLPMSGYNLFVKANRAAFDSQGNVGHPGLLHFSTGPLALPYRLWAEADAENPYSMAVSWTDQLAGSASGNDSLMSVIYQNIDKGAVDTRNRRKDGTMKRSAVTQEEYMLVDTGFLRKDGKATIENPTPEAGDVFLTLFFWNKEMDQYSNDQVFTIGQPTPEQL